MIVDLLSDMFYGALHQLDDCFQHSNFQGVGEEDVLPFLSPHAVQHPAFRQLSALRTESRYVVGKCHSINKRQEVNLNIS